MGTNQLRRQNQVSGRNENATTARWQCGVAGFISAASEISLVALVCLCTEKSFNSVNNSFHLPPPARQLPGEEISNMKVTDEGLKGGHITSRSWF